MSLTKAEVRAAFREAAVRSYAHIPPDEEIDHIFSESFYRRMDALIEEERRGSWRLLSRHRRRALVVAAILAAALLLTACSPKLREAVTEFVVSVYERFVDYGTITGTREEIETIYALNPIPGGFTFVSQTQDGTHFVETIYQNGQGKVLIFKQYALLSLEGTIDNEQGEVIILPIAEEKISAIVYLEESTSTVTWSYDGYCMNLSYPGELDHTEISLLISSVSPSA